MRYNYLSNEINKIQINNDFLLSVIIKSENIILFIYSLSQEDKSSNI